jgi:hypothetical protein
MCYKHFFHNILITFSYQQPGTWAIVPKPKFNELPLCVQWSGPTVTAVWRLKFKPGKQMHPKK